MIRTFKTVDEMTAAFVSEVLDERDTLKAKVMDLTQQLQHYVAITELERDTSLQATINAQAATIARLERAIAEGVR